MPVLRICGRCGKQVAQGKDEDEHACIPASHYLVEQLGHYQRAMQRAEEAARKCLAQEAIEHVGWAIKIADRIVHALLVDEERKP